MTSFFYIHMEISYYWSNIEELFQRAKNCRGKQKAVQYYIDNKSSRYKNQSGDEKKSKKRMWKKQIQRNKRNNMQKSVKGIKF